MEVSTGVAIFWLLSNISWPIFKAFTVHVRSGFSNSGTPVATKVTVGHAHFHFKRRCHMDVVITSFDPCAETSAIWKVPQKPRRHRKQRPDDVIEEISARKTSAIAIWQVCFISSGFAWISKCSQVEQEALPGPDT